MRAKHGLLENRGASLACKARLPRASSLPIRPAVLVSLGPDVEHGETATEALARELREELAVDLQSPLGLPFEEVADSAAAFNMTIWLIDYAGAVVNHAPDEHDELRWVTSAEIAGLALAHPSYVQLLGRAGHA